MKQHERQYLVERTAGRGRHEIGLSCFDRCSPAVLGSRVDRLADAQRILRDLCKDRTQEQIGHEIGISSKSVGDWARGKRAPSAEQLAALRELMRSAPTAKSPLAVP